MRGLACVLSLALAPAAMAQQKASSADGAILRGLNKVDGEIFDMELANGQAFRKDRLTVTLGECRYPAGNPSGDAYAFVTIEENDRDAPVFRGWMIASSPALNALEHPRYDVWVLRCRTE